jgi:hypothetical protein
MKLFNVSWEGYPGNPPSETHGSAYFNEMGFDSTDILYIDDLSVHESHGIGSPLHDTVVVERIA